MDLRAAQAEMLARNQAKVLKKGTKRRPGGAQTKSTARKTS